MEAKLVVVGGKANKAEVKLKLPTVIGRGRDADLTVAHGTVSRHHCLIYEMDGALVVRDNGSLNGTLVEGHRITESLLRPGDTLTVGPLTFRADYEHHGAYPSLSEQPTVPNVQETVGDPAKSNGAPAFAEPPTTSNPAAGQFDFLNDASASAATEAGAAEEPPASELPDFGALAARRQEASDDAAQAEEKEVTSSDGPTLDFAAGGSDVAPVSDDDAPSFGFLDQQVTESVDEAPAFQPGEAEPEAEAAAEGDVPAEPEATSEGGFNFLSEAGEPSATEEPQKGAEAEDDPPRAISESPSEEPVSDAGENSAPGFSFLDVASEPADDEPPAVAGDDVAPQFSASRADEGEADEGSSFGHLGSMASASEEGEAESSRLEITLHDPEESEAEAARLADAPGNSSGGESSLNFDDAEAAPADSAGGFEFLKSGGEPELEEFVAPVDEGDSSEPEALADEDSGEFALPVEEAAAEESGPSFDFLAERGSDEAEEQAADSDDAGVYAMSADPPATKKTPSSDRHIGPAVDETREDEAGDEAIPLEAEAMAPLEDDETDESAAEPAEKGAKKGGWWRFGKSKADEAASQAKAKGKGKPVDKPLATPRALESQAKGPMKFSPTPPADAEEAAMECLSDTPSPSPADTSTDLPAATKDSDVAINTGQAAKKSAGEDDDKLNDFFNSIGLD